MLIEFILENKSQKFILFYLFFILAKNFTITTHQLFCSFSITFKYLISYINVNTISLYYQNNINNKPIKIIKKIKMGKKKLIHPIFCELLSFIR